MNITTLSSKGQITIPIEIRRWMGINPKSKLAFQISNNKVWIHLIPSFKTLRGSVKKIKGDPKKTAQRYVAQHVLESEKS